MFEGPAGVLKKAESKPVCHIKGRNSYRYPVQVVHLFLMLSQVNNCVWKVLYLCNISSVYVCLYMYVCGTWINGWSLDLCSLGRQTTTRMLRKKQVYAAQDTQIIFTQGYTKETKILISQFRGRENKA